jgi:high-affinity iron transporter
MDAWTLRAHEILEDALRDSLSADDDYGSHSDLRSIAADVTATREMLSALQPLLASRAPQLVPTARRELSAVSAAATPPRTAPGGREITSLALRRRQQLDAAVDAALETLAPVSELIQVGSS